MEHEEKKAYGRILVVDDLKINLDVVKRLLQKTKLQVETALNGQEAIDRIRTQDFDMVFMDHMMPDLDGIETLHRLKQEMPERTEHLPIIALTANTEPDLRKFYTAEGFTDYMAKPFVLAQFLELIQRFLPEEKVLGTQTCDEAEKENLPLPQVQGIDWQAAHMYLPDPEVLRSTLEEFVREAQEQVDDTRNACAQLVESPSPETFGNYRIRVHSMKSTLRMIGAKISEVAARLEEAAKNQRTRIIAEETPAFLEKYALLAENLRSRFGQSAGKNAYDRDVFLEGIRNAESAMREFDVNRLQDEMEALARMDLPEPYGAVFEAMKEPVRNLELEDVLAFCRVLLYMCRS